MLIRSTKTPGWNDFSQVFQARIGSGGRDGLAIKEPQTDVKNWEDRIIGMTICIVSERFCRFSRYQFKV
eukprot:scaffold14920_cov63-Cylindrotheca_fusiformis.AAC.10